MATPAARGLALPGFKMLAATPPMRTAPPPAVAVLPLNQHTGAPAIPCIHVGERVLLGQCVARAAEGVSASVHAPVAGKVTAIEDRPAPHVGGAPTLSIVIDNDGSDECANALIEPGTALQLAPEVLRERIQAAGIVGLGGAVFPTGIKLTRGPRQRIEELLINAAECEPYISCDEAALRERAADLVRGVAVVLHALTAERCTIALEADKTRAIAALQQALAAAADARIGIRIVPPIYPSGAERQLITLLYGREVPADGVPTDIGIVCQNVGTVLAIADLDTNGLPLIERIVTVTGHGVRQPANVVVRLGTRIGDLIEFCGGYTADAARLIMGGSMMGIALPHDDLPVVKATNCLLVASDQDLRPRSPEMPCIRCGECATVCPAGLLPQQLHWAARERDLDGLTRLGLEDCIECGCCDYVCPSQIPLATRFRSAKGMLCERSETRERAERAGHRYDVRAQRLEAAAAAREQRLKEKRRSARRPADADPDPGPDR